jgi:hypothetical protein
MSIFAVRRRFCFWYRHVVLIRDALKCYWAIRLIKLEFISNVLETVSVHHQWLMVANSPKCLSRLKARRVCTTYVHRESFKCYRIQLVIHLKWCILQLIKLKFFKTLSTTKLPLFLRQFLCLVSIGQSNTSLTCSILHSFPHPTSKLPSSVLF